MAFLPESMRDGQTRAALLDWFEAPWSAEEASALLSAYNQLATARDVFTKAFEEAKEAGVRPRARARRLSLRSPLPPPMPLLHWPTSTLPRSSSVRRWKSSRARASPALLPPRRARSARAAGTCASSVATPTTRMSASAARRPPIGGFRGGLALRSPTKDFRLTGGPHAQLRGGSPCLSPLWLCGSSSTRRRSCSSTAIITQVR